MKIPRIVLTQPAHGRAWGVSVGEYFLIEDIGGPRGTAHARKELGDELFVSILAERQTILQVRESCSLADAAEKYHNPSSPAFKQLEARMRRGGEQPIYRGPELLLYIHGRNTLATFLLAHGAAQKQFEKLKSNRNKMHLEFWPVVKFSSGNISTGNIRFYTPLLNFTDLRWDKYHSQNQARVLFENASFKAEPYLPSTLKAAVDQFNQAVASFSRVGVKFDRRPIDRQLNNLINEANDGDHFIDEFDGFSMSDHH